MGRCSGKLREFPRPFGKAYYNSKIVDELSYTNIAVYTHYFYSYN